MARPASRYFTPVTKKILAAKKQENIVVDHAFKASLRAELLSSVTAVPRVEGPGWMSFFRKWKYQIAFVPTALLLVLVAMQAMKLPQVTMQSQTVVQLAGTQNPSEDIANVSTPVSGQPDQNLVVHQGKIQTFSGSAVLPSWYGREAITDSSGQAVSEQSSLSLSSVPDVSEKVSGQVESGISAPISAPAESSPAYAVPATNQKVPGIAAGDVPTNDVVSAENIVTPAEPVGGSLTNLGQQNSPVLSQNVVVPASDQLAQTVSVPAEQVLLPKNTDASLMDISAKIQLLRQLNASFQVPVPSVIQPSHALLYNIDLSDADKAQFEREVVAPITKDKDVSLVSVTWAEPGVLAADVVMKDGTSEQHLYRKNSKTHLYEEVQYVMRYFYNDDLLYERAFTFGN